MRVYSHTSAAARLDGQVHCANTLTPVPRTHVPMEANALPLSPSTSVRAHLSSLERPANKTSTNVMLTSLRVRMVECASMRLADTDASVPRSTQANTVRPALCPVIHHHALTEGLVSRKETLSTNALACQVLRGKTATSTLTTAPVTSVRMEAPVWMALTPTTVSVNQNLQVNCALTMLMNVS